MIDFPASPTNGQTFSPPGGPNYVWNGVAWTVSTTTNFMAWPAGTGIEFWGSTAPAGSRFCDGSALSRTAFAALFAAIGTTYGAGDGSTTFNLPDCRGRVVAGKDNMGGTSADRLTNFAGGLNGDVLGAFGGSESHDLATTEIPSHSHTQQGAFASGTGSADHQHTYFQATLISVAGVASGAQYNLTNTATWSSTGGAAHTHNTTISGQTTAIGGGTAHNNVQPTVICNKLITTGGIA